MRIESSNINLKGESYTSASYQLEENLKFWADGQGVATVGIQADVQQFSAAALKTVSAVSAESSMDKISKAEEDAIYQEHSLKIKLIETFLFNLLGKKIDLKMPKLKLSTDGYDQFGQGLCNISLLDGEGQSGVGFGLIYNRNEIQTERTRIAFAAQGIVKTADGRKINLDLNFNVDQTIVEQSSFQLRAGDALKDPLVINFGGGLASFTNSTMSFDLDYDGKKDTINLLGANSGYLALDKNNSGTVDDGRELFGPETDKGYEELARYDEDGNGWIDEGDSVFDHLKIWYHDESGNSHLVALTDKNVGAIYLGHTETEMNLYHQTGMAGKLRESGLVLLENGESRIMQELDVKI